jgi:hypothetical protein
LPPSPWRCPCLANERIFDNRLGGRVWTGGGRWLLAGAIIVVAAFAIRCCQFGNPLIQVDETFYLLVGDRMLHGALPYVDIWDRKPVGLFVLFAGIRLLGGDGIVQYQVVATLFAAGAALLIVRIAEPMAGLLAGAVAGHRLHPAAGPAGRLRRPGAGVLQPVRRQGRRWRP